MQKKRIVVGITAIVVLALLFAGMGYAFNGSARTYNQGDDQTLAYMSVTPENFNPIFTGDTIFDTYVYEGATTIEKKTAYAFNETAETVVDLTVSEVAYKAVKIGTKNMTVLNNTGAAITSLNVEVTTPDTVGTADFKYIFKLTNTESFVAATVYDENVTYYSEADGVYTVAGSQPGSQEDVSAGDFYVQDVQYIVFVNGAASPANITISASLKDTEDNVITVDVYIAYTVNVYVPSTFIGPAADNEGGYFATNVWKDGMQYYTKSDGVYTAASPDQEQVEAGGYYYKAYNATLPYILPTAAPGDLASASFSFKVTDANA